LIHFQPIDLSQGQLDQPLAGFFRFDPFGRAFLLQVVLQENVVYFVDRLGAQGDRSLA
jgi:hypothetical protein